MGRLVMVSKCGGSEECWRREEQRRDGPGGVAPYIPREGTAEGHRTSTSPLMHESRGRIEAERGLVLGEGLVGARRVAIWFHGRFVFWRGGVDL